MNETERKLVEEIKEQVYAAAKENAELAKMVKLDVDLDTSVFVDVDLPLARAKFNLAKLLK